MNEEMEQMIPVPGPLLRGLLQAAHGVGRSLTICHRCTKENAGMVSYSHQGEVMAELLCEAHMAEQHAEIQRLAAENGGRLYEAQYGVDDEGNCVKDTSSVTESLSPTQVESTIAEVEQFLGYV